MYVGNPLSLRERARVGVNYNSVIPAKAGIQGAGGSILDDVDLEEVLTVHINASRNLVLT